MSDVIFVVALVAFFALCALYVQWCDRIVGAGDAVAPGSADDEIDETPVLVASRSRSTDEVRA